MKRIIIILMVLFSLAIAEEIEITTWNLANFGAVKLENQEVMEKVLEILEDSEIICLQEINQIIDVRGDDRNSVEILRDKLTKKTGVEWKLTLSGVTGEGGKKERYAFLWKSGLGTLVNSEIIRFNSLGLETERGYFVTDFNFRGEQIKIISLHAKASGRVAERKLQWEEIAINLVGLPETTKIFFVGDLNMEHNNSFERNFNPLLDLGMETALQKGQLTTLRKNKLIDDNHLAKQVDYIFSKNVVIKNPEVRDFVLEFFKDGDEIDVLGANKVSDHLPISITIDIPDDFPENFKLATWRIRNFSNSSRDDGELFFIRKIAEKYDFLVLQDVKDAFVIQRLVDKLKQRGKNYDFEVKLPYCFMWNSKFIKQEQPARFALSSSGSFQRKPCFAKFKAGKFDFLVLTHHTTTKSLSKTKEEIRLLPDVFREVQNRFPQEKDIILAGSFSRPPRFAQWDELFEIPSMFAMFRKPQKTTISDTDVMDNFFVQLDHLTELGISGIDKFDEELFRLKGDAEAGRAVSRNRPCWIEIYTTDDD